MDYKERYKEALERAKKLQETCDSTTVVGWCEYLFPELKESEDERIRKEIIDFLELPHPQFVGKRDHEKWIAWLEKQGRMLDVDKVIEWIDEHVPTKFEDMANYVQQFKKDFGL